MKKLCLLLFALLWLIPQLVAQDAASSNAQASERHEYIISNFKTEGGVTLPLARVEYGTYGHLNAARDNAVLLPSHHMADFHGYREVL